MALAITTEQEQLVDAVGRFAAGTRRSTRPCRVRPIAAGELPPWWEEFVAHGFHAVHLPETSAVKAAHLADMACVVEAAAAALLPGPLLSTATASAVASLADASADLVDADLAAGATAVVVLPEHSDVRAVTRGQAGGSRLVGLHPGNPVRRNVSCWPRAPRRPDAGSRSTRASGACFTVEQQQGTDLCTDVGVLQPRRPRVPTSSALSGIPTDGRAASCRPHRVRGRRHCAPLRRRGDRLHPHPRAVRQAVGAFQALQHKAAVLLVNTELAAAAAWDAVRAADESVEQHRLAAGIGRPDGDRTGPDLVLDA